MICGAISVATWVLPGKSRSALQLSGSVRIHVASDLIQHCDLRAHGLSNKPVAALCAAQRFKIFMRLRTLNGICMPVASDNWSMSRASTNDGSLQTLASCLHTRLNFPKGPTHPADWLHRVRELIYRPQYSESPSALSQHAMERERLSRSQSNYSWHFPKAALDAFREYFHSFYDSTMRKCPCRSCSVISTLSLRPAN